MGKFLIWPVDLYGMLELLLVFYILTSTSDCFLVDWEAVSLIIEDEALIFGMMGLSCFLSKTSLVECLDPCVLMGLLKLIMFLLISYLTKNIIP